MTPDEINREIAVKVMGWHEGDINSWDDYYWIDKDEILGCAIRDWQPYTNREQALMVVDRMIELGYIITLSYIRAIKSWNVYISGNLDSCVIVDDVSLSAAICEASLRAVGEK